MARRLWREHLVTSTAEGNLFSRTILPIFKRPWSPSKRQSLTKGKVFSCKTNHNQVPKTSQCRTRRCLCSTVLGSPDQSLYIKSWHHCLLLHSHWITCSMHRIHLQDCKTFSRVTSLELSLSDDRCAQLANCPIWKGPHPCYSEIICFPFAIDQNYEALNPIKVKVPVSLLMQPKWKWKSSPKGEFDTFWFVHTC